MLTTQEQEALKQIAAAAVACERVTGCPAELSTAQCIFESNYLLRSPGNNCFGIKSDAHGSGVKYALTHEFLNGMWETIQQSFEAYDTLTDCFNDHARLIQSGAYESAWEYYQKTHDLDQYIAAVSIHYATDPDYYCKIADEVHSETVQQAVATARGIA